MTSKLVSLCLLFPHTLPLSTEQFFKNKCVKSFLVWNLSLFLHCSTIKTNILHMVLWGFALYITTLDYFLLTAHLFILCLELHLVLKHIVLFLYQNSCLCSFICLGHSYILLVLCILIYPWIPILNVTSSRKPSPHHSSLHCTTCTFALIPFYISLQYFSNQQLHIYLHLCVCACLCVYTYIYIYIHIPWRKKSYSMTYC